MKATELREKSVDELHQRERELSEQLFKLRFQRATGRMENPSKMRQIRRFGMANPEGYRKALRLMKLAEKFNKPIVTFIDTPGAYPGLEAEERGQGEAIARNIFEMKVLVRWQ